MQVYLLIKYFNLFGTLQKIKGVLYLVKVFDSCFLNFKLRKTSAYYIMLLYSYASHTQGSEGIIKKNSKSIFF